ncbi:MAG: hypothetical protein ACI4SC_03455, partial [Candidatus Neoclostridium sp.]
MFGNTAVSVKAEDINNVEMEEEFVENEQQNYMARAVSNVVSTAGRITWRYNDETSSEVKPLRTVKVEICKKSGSNYSILGTVYTNADGYYSLSSHQTASSDSIVIRIYPESVFCKVYSYSGSSPTAYMREVSAGTVSGNKKTINYSAVICRLDISENENEMECTINEDKERVYFDNSLMVQQLINFSGRYVKEMHGQNLPKITIYFHHNQRSGEVTNFYRRSNGTRTIYLQFNQCSWFFRGGDTVGHEYGHYVSDLLNLTALPGGDHTANCYDYNINKGTPITKSHALQLAYSEGVATYFSKAAQYNYKEEALGWNYTFAEYNQGENIDVGLDTYGEMGEYTTTRVISALCDFEEKLIGFGLKDKKTLELLKEFALSSYGNINEKRTLSQFVKFLYGKNYLDKEVLAHILTNCEAAPLIKNVTRNGITLTVEFIANGGSQYVANNAFDLVIYNGFGEVVRTVNNISVNIKGTDSAENNEPGENLYNVYDCIYNLSNMELTGRTFSISIIGRQTELGIESGGYYSRLFMVEKNPVGDFFDVGIDVGDEKYCEFVDQFGRYEKKEYFIYFSISGKYTIQTLGVFATRLKLSDSSGTVLVEANENGFFRNSLFSIEVNNNRSYKLTVENRYNYQGMCVNEYFQALNNIKVVIT